MGNRYTKTAFTARQKVKLKRIRMDLLELIDARSGKQDSPSALNALFRADTAIANALMAAEDWLKDN